MRKITFLTAFVLSAVFAKASGNFEAVMNAFIASIAKEHVELKADIKIWQEGEPVPPGYQMGRSVKFDYFIFRPKTWQELSDLQKETVEQHPNLKAFIVSLRTERIYGPVSAAVTPKAPAGWYPVEGEKPREVEYRFTIDPEEMIKNRPTVVTVRTQPKRR